MKVLSLFSGIGAFEKALTNLGVPFELVGYCEIDKYASKSYAAVHGISENMNLWDVTKVDPATLPRDIDLITYGFPCQDISLAGKQKGFTNEDGSLTRSGLFFEALRIIEGTKPKIAIAENVKNLTGKKFSEQFQIVLQSLEQAGYNNYWKVLNAKDYGIPQNRERVFIVSIRKDIDHGLFEFPAPFPLTKRLKDVLENEVDEKFYLSDTNLKWLDEHNSRHTEKGTGFLFKPKNPETDIGGTIRANPSFAPTDNAVVVKEAKLIQAGQMYPNSGNPQAGRIYDSEGLSPAMDTCQGGNRMPKVVIPQATKQGYAECEIGGVADLSFPGSTTRRGRVQDGGNICPTITAESNGLCRIEEATAVAMRGRPSEGGTNQNIELSDREYANSITTVQKDSMVAEEKTHD